ncbi:hypothetical protein ACR9E3_22445 [Actinomycetospora sp. C-140]
MTEDRNGAARAPLPARTPRAALAAKREYWEWRRPGPDPLAGPVPPLAPATAGDGADGVGTAPRGESRAVTPMVVPPPPPPSRPPLPPPPASPVPSPPASPVPSPRAARRRPVAPGRDLSREAPRGDEGGAGRWHSAFDDLAGLPGAEYVASVDDETGACLRERGERDEQVDALLGWARRTAAVSADRRGSVEDIVVTTPTAHHLLRPLDAPSGRPAWVHLRLGRPRGNLAMARQQLAELGRDATGPRSLPPAPSRIPAPRPPRPSPLPPLSSSVPPPSSSLPPPSSSLPPPSSPPSRPPTPPSPRRPEPDRAPAAPSPRPTPAPIPAPTPDPAPDADGRPDDHAGDEPGETASRPGAVSRCLAVLRDFVHGPDDDPDPRRRAVRPPTPPTPSV